MKYLAAVLLVVSINAHADVMTLQNNSHGEIVLTAEACPWSEDNELYYAYTYSDAETVKGCWMKESNTIIVGWVIENQIKYKVYDATKFKLKKTI